MGKRLVIDRGRVRAVKPPPPNDPPLTLVWNVNDSNARPRLVRLYPEEAVLYCYMDSVGVLGAPRSHYQDQIKDTGAGPICGSWWAKERERA